MKRSMTGVSFMISDISEISWKVKRKTVPAPTRHPARIGP
jgi:hypothetical protein